MNFDIRVFKNIGDKKPFRTFNDSKISIDEDGGMLVMDSIGKNVLADFTAAKFKWAQAAGIMFAAFECTGIDKHGAQNFALREIFCAYQTNPKG